MIANCEGCKEEFKIACEMVKEGYHIATTKNREFISRGHLQLIMVNDKGGEVLW